MNEESPKKRARNTHDESTESVHRVFSNRDLWSHFSSYFDEQSFNIPSVCRIFRNSSLANYHESRAKLSSIVHSVELLQKAVECGAPRKWIESEFIFRWSTRHRRLDALNSAIELGAVSNVNENDVYSLLREMLEYFLFNGSLEESRVTLYNEIIIPSEDDSNTVSRKFLAAACGHYELLDLDFRAIPFDLKSRIVTLLSFWDNDELLQQLMRPREHYPRSCYIAAGRGRIELFTFLWMNQRCDRIRMSDVVRYSANGGDLRLVQQLARVSRAPIGDPVACGAAAYNGHLNMLKWFRNQTRGVAQWEKSVVINAARRGHLNILDWLYENRKEQAIPDNWFDLRHTFAIEYASRDGLINVLDWIYNHADVCPRESCIDAIGPAAIRGHLHILQWFFNHGFELQPYTISDVVESGNLNAIQWLDSVRNQWRSNEWNDTTLMERAAESGRLHVLRWLHDHNVPWDTRACIAAAEYGNLSAIRWLLNNGAPINEDACFVACENEEISILEWGLQQNHETFPCDGETLDIIEEMFQDSPNLRALSASRRHAIAHH